MSPIVSTDLPVVKPHELAARLKAAGITHDELAAAAGIARVTATRELGGSLRLQARTIRAAEALLSHRPLDLLQQAAALLDAEEVAGP